MGLSLVLLERLSAARDLVQLFRWTKEWNRWTAGSLTVTVSAAWKSLKFMVQKGRKNHYLKLKLCSILYISIPSILIGYSIHWVRNLLMFVAFVLDLWFRIDLYSWYAGYPTWTRPRISKLAEIGIDPEMSPEMLDDYMADFTVPWTGKYEENAFKKMAPVVTQWWFLKYFLFSTLLGEMIHFDEHKNKWVETTN